jgi:crotonobetaine/carnitine-CoA ligase
MTTIEIPLKERLIGHFLRKQATEKPDKPFLTVAGRSLTFAQTDADARAVARGLAKCGIGDGGRVMMMLPNCLEFVTIWFAASLRGAAEIPINPNLKGILLEAVLSDSKPQVFVVHASLAPELEAIDAALIPPHVFVVGSVEKALSIGPASVAPFEELYVREGEDPEIPGDFRRIQSIAYTSGTTGPSKGAMVSNAATFCAPINYIKIMGMGPEDSIYSPLPLFHGMSSRHGILPSLVLGARITIDESFSASRYWERAAECEATLGMVVHAVVPLLKVQPPRDSDRAHRLRAIFNAKHDKEVEERFGVLTVEAYAVTETSHILHTPYPQRRWGSTGRVNDLWEVRLVDSDDLPVPRGQAGELICRPKEPHIMMSGYLNKPDITLEAVRHLWYHTGDILREDEDGYFYYLDRKKDRIRRRGENVSSQDVEVAIVAHPEVAECAVVPYPADDGEDHIRAIVIASPGSALEAPALHEWLTGRMPKFMLPRYIEIVDRIPRTGTGKFEKHKIIEQGLGPGAWDAGKVLDTRKAVAASHPK